VKLEDSSSTLTVLARLCSVATYADSDSDANEALLVRPPFTLKVNIKSVRHLPQMGTRSVSVTISSSCSVVMDSTNRSKHGHEK
jgi:hypothetical protein